MNKQERLLYVCQLMHAQWTHAGKYANKKLVKNVKCCVCVIIKSVL